MSRMSTSFVYLLALGLLPLTFSGCMSPFAGAGDGLAAPNQEAARPADKTKADAADADDKEAKEIEKLEHRRAKMERDLQISRQKLTRAEMAAKHTELAHQVSLRKAEMELDLAHHKFKDYAENSVPQRIARAELNVRRSQDRLREAEQELAQLEMLYAEEEFADKTKEIVLERGKQRLERSREGHAITQRDLTILLEFTIPIEMKKKEMEVDAKERQLERSRRDAEAAALDKAIALMSAEAEVTKLETDYDALLEKIAEKKQKKD